MSYTYDIHVSNIHFTVVCHSYSSGFVICLLRHLKHCLNKWAIDDDGDDDDDDAEGSQPSKGSNDDASIKDPMKTKELEDKFNGKILENGVCYVLFLNTHIIVKCGTY